MNTIDPYLQTHSTGASQDKSTGRTATHQCDGGMTLRDYFAAHAPEPPKDFDWADGERDSWQRMTRWRYHYADAMLKARKS